MDRQRLFTSGYPAQAGYFLKPHLLEVAVRTSQVDGQFGHGQEYTAGLTRYVKGNPLHKWSVDFQRLLNDPGSNVFTGYVAGQTGYMLRCQYEIGF